mmetsp:Transcript_45635/g.108638  ORF Transcript_45635/g.108638 Transcript_45635/m.108638 type:complete len:330 (+) Transcript_45635:101-1090(+)
MSQRMVSRCTLFKMASRFAFISTGCHTPAGTLLFCTSSAKAAVPNPTHCSRSLWVTLRQTSSPSAPLASTRMALAAPTNRSTVVMIGIENIETACISSLFRRMSVGRFLTASKSQFQMSGSVPKLDRMFRMFNAFWHVYTSGSSNKWTWRSPMPGPKSASRRPSQGRARFSTPSSKTTTGSASKRKVALTMVGPAPPVPAVKNDISTDSAAPPSLSTASRTINADTPGQIPAETIAGTPDVSAALDMAFAALHSSVSSQTSTYGTPASIASSRRIGCSTPWNGPAVCTTSPQSRPRSTLRRASRSQRSTCSKLGASRLRCSRHLLAKPS